MSFDRLAGCYRTFEAIVVGSVMQQARTAFLSRCADGRHALLVGEGPGRFLVPTFGAMITWILGSWIFLQTGHLGVFSLGYDDLSSALASDLGWQMALLLLITKFAATITCYGSGGCGGIFSPTLFLGGMTGVAISGLVGLEWSVSQADGLALAVVGMSSCLGAVVFAPVTGILIVFEMTHEFGLVPALMLGALVSQTISRRMSHENFYDSLLMQDGHRLEQVRPPRDLESWQQLPVSAIANFSPVVLPNLFPETIRLTLEAHPYHQFPVIQNGVLAGILSRAEAESRFGKANRSSVKVLRKAISAR